MKPTVKSVERTNSSIFNSLGITQKESSSKSNPAGKRNINKKSSKYLQSLEDTHDLMNASAEFYEMKS